MPNRKRAAVVCALLLSGLAAATAAEAATLHDGRLPNNVPFVNGAGTAASFSTAGFVDLQNPFHHPQGTNGRACDSCHLVQAGWSVRPIDVEAMFFLTRGTHPLFNVLDANSPAAKTGTVAERYAAYSMLRKGLFRRGGFPTTPPEFEVVAIDDPLRAGGTATRFEFFRRPLATANFHIAENIGWHDQNTNGSGDIHAGLTSQVANNITNGQQGPANPDPAIVEDVVVYQEGLAFAQQSVWGIGRLDTCGARGGPEPLSAQAPVSGRFDLYDAWIDLAAGSCTTRSADRKRARIARGQELFNDGNGSGRCSGCHDAANNGSNTAGRLFDVGASRAEFREPGLPLYTLRNKVTLEEKQTTDPGRAVRSGRWSDIDRFKTPSLRGLAARPPYFHNGIAATLRDVVRHYERALGFDFSPEEEEDLVAFLEAL